MNFKKVVYNHNLRRPDGIKVTYAGQHKWFQPGPNEEKEIIEWLITMCEEGQKKNPFWLLMHNEAIVSYDIDWDCDNILYCKFIIEK